MSKSEDLFEASHLPRPSSTYRGSGNDKSRRRGDTQSMEYVDKDLLSAKLEAIEARMDGRVASIEGKIDSFLAVQAVRDQSAAQRFDRIESDVSEIKALFGSMKTTMIVTGISTVLAIVIGIAGFNAMLTSNMLASFQAGRVDVAVIDPQAAAPLSSLPSVAAGALTPSPPADSPPEKPPSKQEE